MAKVTAFLLLSLFAVGCGFDPNAEIGEINSRLHPQCGWILDTGAPILDDGSICFAETTEGCGWLMIGDDPCTDEPSLTWQPGDGDSVSWYKPWASECTLGFTVCETVQK